MDAVGLKNIREFDTGDWDNLVQPDLPIKQPQEDERITNPYIDIKGNSEKAHVPSSGRCTPANGVSTQDFQDIKLTQQKKHKSSLSGHDQT